MTRSTQVEFPLEVRLDRGLQFCFSSAGKRDQQLFLSREVEEAAATSETYIYGINAAFTGKRRCYHFPGEEFDAPSHFPERNFEDGNSGRTGFAQLRTSGFVQRRTSAADTCIHVPLAAGRLARTKPRPCTDTARRASALIMDAPARSLLYLKDAAVGGDCATNILCQRQIAGWLPGWFCVRKVRDMLAMLAMQSAAASIRRRQYGGVSGSDAGDAGKSSMGGGRTVVLWG